MTRRPAPDRPRAALLAVASTAALLSACGNAVDRFDIGHWQPAGGSGPARYPRGDDGDPRGPWLLLLADGRGREVALGDAVSLEVVVTTTARDGRVVDAPPRRLWLFTGFEGPLEAWGDERGRLGDPRLRARLVGLREGASLALPAVAREDGGHEVVVPTRGLHAVVPLRLEGLAPGPELTLASGAPTAAGERVESRVRVLETCPAQLYQRTSVVSQWGYVLLPGSGRDVPASRRGEIYWGGLRADCPHRPEPIWFQSAPAAGAGLRGGNALDIERSFAGGHPRLRHDADWRGDVAEEPLPDELRGTPLHGAGVGRARAGASSPDEIERKIRDIDEGRAPPGR